ncbi:DUF732 domain-containing protein [Streptomyces sp. NBC_01281]|uniref:DUF732 domain-containing protein n=1 Tax=unclassified Streptomyces TaxID=2593676 RepID=UPI0013B5B32A|nr:MULTISPECIES: DUF732 domain-containing protein [unclassified Streptomyces]NEB28561.1 DUF732 domain-containing protein [Streptomyces sp. SID14446]WSK65696.1 DUF732 domain-containing protein [Streptomyces sp. NBC_01281]
MRTRTTIATLGILACALAGCSVETDSGTTDSKPKTSPSAKAKNHTTAETAFLVTTRNKIPELNKISDKDLINFGRTSCDAVDAGNSPVAVTIKAEEGLQLGDENTAYIVGAAVNTFCPEHKAEL